MANDFKKMAMWAGSGGFVLALLVGALAGFGLWATPAWMLWVLGILGVVTGLSLVSKKEATGFLIAIIGLTIFSGALAWIPFLADAINEAATALLAFVAPAALIVVFMQIWRAVKN